MVREVLTLERLAGMDPDEAAAKLLARRADGLTEQEETLLAEWLRADAAHERAFGRASRAWDIFDAAADNDLLDAMRTRARDARPNRRFAWPQLAAMAAMLLVVLGIGWMLIPNGGQVAPQDRAIRYAAAPGAVKEFALPDGTTMTLDADSVAVGRFGAARRSVELVRGRAYFAVTADRDRPFAVAAAGQLVTAVGTVFDVGLAGEALTVTLAEGRVTVGPRDASSPPVALAPGQQLRLTGDTAVIRTLGGRAADQLGWRAGLLDFDDTTLAEAVAQANRYSPRQVLIRDPRVAALRVSGQFRAGDAERFAATIAELYPVRIERRGDAIELVSRK